MFSHEQKPDLQSLYSHAFDLHLAGREAEAEAAYRAVLSAEPGHVKALHMMGVLSLNKGHYEEAARFLKSALAEEKTAPLFFTLGSVYMQQNKADEAAENYEQALILNPYYPAALNNLGLVYQDRKKYGQAKECFERAIQCDSSNADYFSNYGELLKVMGEFDEAVSSFRHALMLRPDYWQIHASIGRILQEQGNIREAAQEYRRGLSVNPDSFEILNNLGTAQHMLGRYDEALGYYESALRLEPQRADVMSNMAMTLKDMGRLEEAIEWCRTALKATPDNAWIYSNILLTMVYTAFCSPKELAEAARGFGRTIADPLLSARLPRRDLNMPRKLKIGYVSPEFCESPVRYFIEPLIELHDRKQFEIYAYYNLRRDDAVMHRLKGKFDHWRDIHQMNDEDAADLIEKDKIDILVDLTGHAGNNRLLLFARKPAPVQVTWLGYPATTGVKAIDYRITDPYTEPPGMTEHLNTETLWRLPEIFCCYRADEKSPAPPERPPSEDNGYITFGCFNNFSKVTDDVMAAWAEIMKRVPNSRLLLEIRGAEEQSFYKKIRERLEKKGLPPERVTIEPRKNENQYVLYNRIDIALDPFPCNGGTTSMDTLWMGVPLITLAGKHFVSRMGVSLLTNAGLPNLIAEDVANYVQIAVDLAKDPERLRLLRHGLREKVAASPLMDHEKFTARLEAAYREMWRIHATGDDCIAGAGTQI